MPTPKKEGLFVHDLLNSTRDLLLILLRVLSLFVPLLLRPAVTRGFINPWIWPQFKVHRHDNRLPLSFTGAERDYGDPGAEERQDCFAEQKNAQGSMERRVYGVLTDCDLSSFTATMNSDYKKTSQQRTGTPPYMAHELLRGTSVLHLYRHDLESLFYIMLLTAARHTIGTPEREDKPGVILRGSGNLPYEDWFNEPRYRVLGSLKGSFLSESQPIALSRDFEDFRPWLEDLQQSFSSGFSLGLFSSKMWTNPILRAAVNSTVAKFDDATLGDASLMPPSWHESTT